MSSLKFGDKVIDAHSPVFIIAEAGINHNGSLKLAKELILMAKLSGCDFVKFQKRSPDITTPEKKKNQLIFLNLW